MVRPELVERAELVGCSTLHQVILASVASVSHVCKFAQAARSLDTDQAGMLEDRHDKFGRSQRRQLHNERRILSVGRRCLRNHPSLGRNTRQSLLVPPW